MSRQTLITFQPAEIVDHVLADGTELTKLPYPVHAWASDGVVPNHLGGYTEPHKIVGFTSEEGKEQHRLDLTWGDAARDPQRAVGMFIVCRMPDGDHQLLTSPVRDVEAREFERPDTISATLSAPVDSERRKTGWQ